MCGITGVFSPDQADNLLKISREMANAILHRGPDDSGNWVDRSVGIALAHRRLSIVDTSAAGHQPMVSTSGRYILVFNGECYNHLSLRIELEKSKGKQIAWRGHSDTETLLAAFEQWGFVATLSKCVGMFAIALWDRKKNMLSLAIDRAGEKPLYYGWQNNVFLFGSELKAIKKYPYFQADISRNSISLLLRYNCIPAPFSIYQGVYKLLPGTYIQLPLNIESSSRKLPTPEPYWSLFNVVSESGRFDGSENEAVDELERLLSNSIKQQMIADVPLGAFLSGGIDSSTIVALMQSQSDRPVKTFTIGFDELGYNEAEYAKAVASHLNTDHTELYVSAKDAINVIPYLPAIYDEPFSDTSQIPTYLVSQLAKNNVTVSLSGDGGDELFAGYTRYFQGQALWSKLSPIPRPVRSMMSKSITSLSPQYWDRMSWLIGCLAPSLKYRTGDKLHKLANVLDVSSFEEMYQNLISHWVNPSEIALHSIEPFLHNSEEGRLLNLENFTQRMMFFDTTNYLPNDILVKVDRAAMAVSLETRVPFLDHRIIEFAQQVPLSMKIRDGKGKWIVRELLNRYIPKELIDRPKMGFGVPIDIWLRGPLRDWAEELLDESRLKSEGYLNHIQIRKKMDEHISGKRNWQYQLWNALMFQAWLERE